MLQNPVPGTWLRFDCPRSTARWRYLPDGHVEIENEGLATASWPKHVDDWFADIVAMSAKYEIPASWIATIMAVETGGVPGLCRKEGGVCSRREGVGLMAVLYTTAQLQWPGQPVDFERLRTDNSYNIETGVRYLKNRLVSSNGEFVQAALMYNAGSVKCSPGATWEEPHEACGYTNWGVKMGCVRVNTKANEFCIPSPGFPGKYNCPVDYPRHAIGLLNAAIDAGWTGRSYAGSTPGPAPSVAVKAPETPGVTTGQAILAFAVGAVVGATVTVSVVVPVVKHSLTRGR